MVSVRPSWRPYAALLVEARQLGTKVFFADEAHFRADADLRGKWVLKGEPALVESTSPRWGEKASYYSAVCLETGEVEIMELQGYSNAETSTAFLKQLKQLRDKHAGPLNVIWDNVSSPGMVKTPCVPTWLRHARRLVFQPAEVLVTREMPDRDTRTDQPDSAGTWLACFESTGIWDSYGVVRDKEVTAEGDACAWAGHYRLLRSCRKSWLPLWESPS